MESDYETHKAMFRVLRCIKKWTLKWLSCKILSNVQST